MARIVRLTLLVAVTAVFLSLVLTSVAETAANPVQVNPIPPAKQEPGKAVTLGAKVVDTTNGRPVSSVEVTFFVETEVFGPRLMNVGKAITDATGSAYLAYKPSWEGETNVVLRFQGNEQYAAATGTLRFSAIGPAHVHQNADFGLAPVRKVLPFVVLLLVVTVWGALLFTLVHTVRGIGFARPHFMPEATARRRREQTAERS